MMKQNSSTSLAKYQHLIEDIFNNIESPDGRGILIFDNSDPAKMIYANDQTRNILGIGINDELPILKNMIEEEEDRKIFAQQRKRRFEDGKSDCYQIRIKNAKNEEVKVEMYGIPLKDNDNSIEVVGSLVIVRNLKHKEIRDEIQNSFIEILKFSEKELSADIKSVNKFLIEIANALRKILPFDMFIVCRYSQYEGKLYGNPFLTVKLEPEDWLKNWYPIEGLTEKWLYDSENGDVFEDIEGFKKKKGYENIDDIFEPGMKLEGGDYRYRSFYCYHLRSGKELVGHDHRLGHNNLQESQLAKVDSDAKEGAGRNDDQGQLVGTIAFWSKTKDNFKKEEKKKYDDLLEYLQIDKAVRATINRIETIGPEFQLDLYDEILKCENYEKVADKLAEKLQKFYGWTYVAVYKVDDNNKKFVRLATHPQPEEDLDGSVSFNNGDLGDLLKKALDKKDFFNPGDVKRHYNKIEIKSQLFYPLSCENKVKWILTIGDDQQGAFCGEEINQIKETLKYVGITLDNIDRWEYTKQLELLNKTYYEIAVQTQTPLALAFAYLGDMKNLDIIEKTKQQLNKLQTALHRITLDRIEYERTDKILMNLRKEIEFILQDFPENERERIKIEPLNGSFPIKGDIFQIDFIFKTIFSYFIRLLPEGEGKEIRVTLNKENGKIIIDIHGYELPIREIPEKSRVILSKILPNLALGIGTVKKFIDNHEGSLESCQTMKTNDFIAYPVTFKIEFPETSLEE